MRPTPSDLAYRAAWEKFIADFPATHAVTLAFNRDTELDAAKHELRGFQAFVDRALFRREWAQAPDRTRIVAVAENMQTNLHWHAVVTVAPYKAEKFAAACDKAWRKLIPGGSVKVEAIYDAAGWASYICKQIRDGESHRTWFSDNVAQPSNG